MSPLAKPMFLNRELTFTNALRAFIQQATEHPKNQMILSLYAHRFSVQSQTWLSTDEFSDIEPKLSQLIIEYCQYLPTLMEEFGRYCDHFGWQTIAEKSNIIIASFFDKPDRCNGQVGLIALLDKVYFSHRMFEELNDHIMCLVGFPTSTWNMTTINLLVHQMLGSEYSGRLDVSAIEISQKLLADAPAPILSGHKKDQSFDWPCFCQQQGLNQV